MFTPTLRSSLRGVCESNHATHSKLLRCCVLIPSSSETEEEKKEKPHGHRTKSQMRPSKVSLNLPASCFSHKHVKTTAASVSVLELEPASRSCSLQGFPPAPGGAGSLLPSFLPHLPQLLSPARPTAATLQSSISF